jgi:hypothetical protein
LQIRAEARQAKIFVPEDKHFAGHEKKPTACHRHHRVPHQANGGEGQVQFHETLPAAEAINDGRFPQVTRNRFQRRVKTKSNVPDLSGENQNDGAQFHPQLAAGE